MRALLRNLAILSALLLLRCSASTAGLAPLEWEKVPGTGPGGAVLGLGSPTKFDERGNFTVRAFKDGDGPSSAPIGASGPVAQGES